MIWLTKPHIIFSFDYWLPVMSKVLFQAGGRGPHWSTGSGTPELQTPGLAAVQRLAKPFLASYLLGSMSISSIWNQARLSFPTRRMTGTC